MDSQCRKPGRPKDELLAERRCEEIIRVVISHFARDGYHNADLEKIARDIGCAKGTLFRYFPTKRDLFEKAVDFVMDEFCRWANQDVTESDLIGDLERSFLWALAFFEDRPEYVELLIQERAVFKDRDRPSFFIYDQARIDRWRKRIDAETASGRLRQTNADSILDFGATLIYGTIFTHYFVKKTKSLQDQAREATDIFLRGILSAKALAEYDALHADQSRKTKPRPADKSTSTTKPKSTKGKTK